MEQVSPAFKAHLDNLVPQDRAVLEDYLVLLVQLVYQELMAVLDLREQLVIQVDRDLLENQDLPGNVDQLEYKVSLVHLEILDLLDNQDLPVLQALQVLKDLWVKQEVVVQQELLENLD